MVRNVAFVVGQNIESGQLRAKQDSKACSATPMATASWQSNMWHCGGYFSRSTDNRDLPVQSIHAGEMRKQQTS